MPKYLLDTDHLSLLDRGHPGIRQAIEAKAVTDVAVSIVSVEEQVRGRIAITHRARTGSERVIAYAKLQQTIEANATAVIAPFDQAAEARYQELRALKLRIGTQDQKIAAIALATDAILVTRNRRDFEQVPGLVTEDWS